MSLAVRLLQRLRSASGLGAVLTGNIVSAGLGFVILLLLTRNLAPAEFGILAPIISLLEIGQIVIETSVVAGAVQVATQYLGRDSERVQMAYKIGFLMRCAVGGVLMVVGFLAAPWILDSLLGGQSWLLELVLALVAINAVAVYLSAMSVLLTKQLYTRLAIATVLKNGLRVVLIAILMFTDFLSISSAVWAYAGAAAGCAFISLVISPPTFLRLPGWDPTLARKMIAINKWAAIAGIAMLGTRIDIFMLSGLSSDAQVGIYASAFQLISIITIFSQSWSNYLFPKIVAYRNRCEMRLHMRRMTVLIPAILVPLLPLLAISGYVIPFLLGEHYAAAIQAFDLLAISAFISLALNPIGLLLFPLRRTRTLAITNIAQLVLRLLLNIALIPGYGAVGVAFAEIISKVVVSTIVVCLICYDVYLGDSDEDLPEKGTDTPANSLLPR